MSDTVRIRIPKALYDAVVERAETNGQTPHAELRDAIKKGLRETQEIPVREGRDPWVDRARLLEALHCLWACRPSGYQELSRIIHGAMVRAGEEPRP